MRPRRMAAVTVVLAVGAAMAASVAAQAHPQVQRRDLALAANSGIHKIKHIIFITQENRSFDNYFGTFPGAVGIPKGVCAPDPRNGGCRRPWVDHHNSNGNNPHAEEPFKIDYNGGKMNGFVRAAEEKLCKPKPAKCHPDVMGYHVASDIPNYWRYAKNFVLQDHFFEAAGSWSPASPGAATAPTCPQSGCRTGRRRSRGPTSPGCCTGMAFAGPTTSTMAPSPCRWAIRPEPRSTSTHCPDSPTCTRMASSAACAR